ncbi:unnamed protein product [Prorocentrum cordatum]|nr:unnamed protein product [Polarella glacialis]
MARRRSAALPSAALALLAGAALRQAFVGLPRTPEPSRVPLRAEPVAAAAAAAAAAKAAAAAGGAKAVAGAAGAKAVAAGAAGAGGAKAGGAAAAGAAAGAAALGRPGKGAERGRRGEPLDGARRYVGAARNATDGPAEPPEMRPLLQDLRAEPSIWACPAEQVLFMVVCGLSALAAGAAAFFEDAALRMLICSGCRYDGGGVAAVSLDEVLWTVGFLRHEGLRRPPRAAYAPALGRFLAQPADHPMTDFSLVATLDAGEAGACEWAPEGGLDSWSHLTSAFLWLMPALAWLYGGAEVSALLAALWRRGGLPGSPPERLAARDVQAVFAPYFKEGEEHTGRGKLARSLVRELFPLLAGRGVSTLADFEGCRCFEPEDLGAVVCPSVDAAIWGYVDPPFRTRGDLDHRFVREFTLLEMELEFVADNPPTRAPAGSTQLEGTLLKEFQAQCSRLLLAQLSQHSLFRRVYHSQQSPAVYVVDDTGATQVAYTDQISPAQPSCHEPQGDPLMEVPKESVASPGKGTDSSLSGRATAMPVPESPLSASQVGAIVEEIDKACAEKDVDTDIKLSVDQRQSHSERQFVKELEGALAGLTSGARARAQLVAGPLERLTRPVATQLRLALHFVEVMVQPFGAGLSWSVLLPAGSFVVELQADGVGLANFVGCFQSRPLPPVAAGPRWPASNAWSEWGSWARRNNMVNFACTSPRPTKAHCARSVMPRAWDSASLTADVPATVLLVRDAVLRLRAGNSTAPPGRRAGALGRAELGAGGPPSQKKS